MIIGLPEGKEIKDGWSGIAMTAAGCGRPVRQDRTVPAEKDAVQARDF